MISTVHIARNTTACVAVEHPDEWDDDQIAEAAKNRAIDIAARASMWSGDDRTTIASVHPGEDYREAEETMDYPPKPVILTDADLDAVPDPVVEDMAGEEHAEDHEPE